jgi:hypothetical protein
MKLLLKRAVVDQFRRHIPSAAKEFAEKPLVRAALALSG